MRTVTVEDASRFIGALVSQLVVRKRSASHAERSLLLGGRSVVYQIWMCRMKMLRKTPRTTERDHLRLAARNSIDRSRRARRGQSAIRIGDAALSIIKQLSAQCLVLATGVDVR